jgi:hypothetical protein
MKKVFISVLGLLALAAVSCTDRSLSKVDEVGEGDPLQPDARPGGSGGAPDARRAPDAAVQADARRAPDAASATPDAAPGSCEPGTHGCVCTAETCEPGIARWCDTPRFCSWGVQTCGPDGAWGACLETNDRPGSCGGPQYNVDCCVNAGGCCQDFLNSPGTLSIGDCPGVTQECHKRGY